MVQRLIFTSTSWPC